LPISELASASSARVAGSAAFTEVKSGIQKIAGFYKIGSGEVSLQPAPFQSWRAQNDALMLTKESAPKSAGAARFAVMNHGAEKVRLQSNAYAGEINNIQLQQLGEDIYIEETYRIVTDLIQKTNLK
jgi:hypothetical protein